HAVLQIAGNALQSEKLMAGHGQAPSVTILLAAETETGVEIGHVVDEFVERIGGILQRRANGEPILLLEEADDTAASRRHAAGIDEPQPAAERSGDGGGGGRTDHA